MPTATSNQKVPKPSTVTQEIPKKEKKIDELTFVRLKIPKLIPENLIESVKGRTFTPTEFYKYQESQVDNPFNHLFVLVDESKKIHGYLWSEMNMLDGSLFVNTFSISKEYWGKGQAIPKVIEFLRVLRGKVNASKVFWITTNEKFFAKHHFKRSRNVLMEYNLN